MSGGAAPLDGLRHMALKTTTPENAPARFRICTDDFPPRERALAWRELYGRSVLRLEIEPLSDAPFSSELLISQMPDLGVARGHASPFRVGRTRELLTDGDDGLIFQITDVAGRAAQLGHDVDVAANEAVLLSCADIGSFTFPASCKVLALRLRRARPARPQCRRYAGASGARAERGVAAADPVYRRARRSAAGERRGGAAGDNAYL